MVGFRRHLDHDSCPDRMRRRGAEAKSLVVVAQTSMFLLSMIVFLGALCPREGQAAISKRKCIEDTCVREARGCKKGFRRQLRTAKADCAAESTRRSRRLCRKGAKRFFHQDLARCKQARQTCTACCRSDDRIACNAAVCGDSFVAGTEECDIISNVDCPRRCQCNCKCGPLGCKDCRVACQRGKRHCLIAAKHTYEAARSECSELAGSKSDYHQCKRAVHSRFKQGKRNCSASYTACRWCCGSENPTDCKVSFCGDGVKAEEEECDGAEDAACPDGCRADCTCSGSPTPAFLDAVSSALD